MGSGARTYARKPSARIRRASGFNAGGAVLVESGAVTGCGRRAIPADPVRSEISTPRKKKFFKARFEVIAELGAWQERTTLLGADFWLAPNALLSGRPPTLGGRAVAAMLSQAATERRAADLRLLKQ